MKRSMFYNQNSANVHKINRDRKRRKMLKQPYSTKSVTNIAVFVNRSRSEQQREPNELGKFGFCVRDEEQPQNVLPVKNDGESLRLTKWPRENSSQSLSQQALSSLTQPHALYREG
ncbi:hypothetical protein M9H77_18155 [Catharanthus roseus]|uniref:Uncharacterized protein n=1 Tax=Catharanthus roseus TaxID=4058 RepID=A0ACC0B6V3_CATRO|nr:hypothetical protein M9H77_18155 [Catharanthus roseus]